MTEMQAVVVIAFADNNMNMQATARQLYYHRNTVVYNIAKVREQTGKDPMNFYDLCKLLPIARSVVAGKKQK